MKSSTVLLAWVARKGRVSSSAVAKHLGISRQAAHKKLRALEQAGQVNPVSAGRTAAWEAVGETEQHRYATRGLAEDRVYRELMASSRVLAKLGAAARRILAYAFTEMLNNAIDHSGAKTVTVKLGRTQKRVWFEVADGGRGAFERVREDRKLASVEDALAELSKGKVTTAPEAHSGEGIFFTSKCVDRFELMANGLHWIVDNTREDHTVLESPRRRGTLVRCEIEASTRRDLAAVFAAYTVDDAFLRSRIVVKLFTHGTEFVSRSEARRLLEGLDQFREVVLDFTEVEAIGQGFADEVLRVWPRRHPETTITWANASRPVSYMLRRALAPR